MPLIDYKLHAIERKYDLSQTEEKRRYVQEALGVIATAESESLKEELLKKLRQKAGVSYHSLERDLQKVEKNPVESTERSDTLQTRIAETVAGIDKTVKAIRFILASKLFASPFAKGFDVDTLPLTDGTHKTIANYVKEREKANERIRPSELFEIVNEDDGEINAIFDLNLEDKLTGDVAERFFKDSVKDVERRVLETRLRLLNDEYALKTDESERRALAKEIAQCVAGLNKLKK
jgi:DNA primase